MNRPRVLTWSSSYSLDLRGQFESESPMSKESSEIPRMPRDQRGKLESYAKLLLLWVAASDGKLEESEMEFVSSKLPDTDGSITTDDFLAVIRQHDLKIFEDSVRAIANQSRQRRTAFLETAMALSMADYNIADAENHILRFYADALYLGIEILEKRFETVTGLPFPEPGGPVAVLPDEDRRSEDDLTQAIVKTIGVLRHRLDLDSDGSWFLDNYPDFAPMTVLAGVSEESRKPEAADSPCEQAKPEALSRSQQSVIYGVVIVAVALAVLAYSLLTR